MLSMPIEMVGKVAGGLSLFALGLLFYGERPTVNIQTCTNISIKNLLQPAMMAVAGLAFGLSHSLMQQAIIIGATPSAIAAGDVCPAQRYLYRARLFLYFARYRSGRRH